MNTLLKRAASDPIRTSQARAVERPAPAATPLIAPITGLSKPAHMLAQRPTQPMSSNRSF